MDSEKTKLVDRVEPGAPGPAPLLRFIGPESVICELRTYQRGSPEQKETWYNFCGEVAGQRTASPHLGY